MKTSTQPAKPLAKPLAVHIRWMIRRDMPEVLQIEQRAFEFPWCQDQFVNCLRQRNCIGMVAEHNERVVGFMIYELHKNRLHVLSLAVHPDFRRHGVGTAMVKKLQGKLTTGRRDRILIDVRETNLDAQRFFRACGFRAVAIRRELYPETSEDAYTFRYTHQAEVQS